MCRCSMGGESEAMASARPFRRQICHTVLERRRSASEVLGAFGSPKSIRKENGKKKGNLVCFGFRLVLGFWFDFGIEDRLFFGVGVWVLGFKVFLRQLSIVEFDCMICVIYLGLTESLQNC